MTDTPKIIDIDCSTGVSIERDMTEQEIFEMQERFDANQAAAAERLAEEEEKAAKKASVLAALATATGLTAEDLSAALG